MHLPWQGRTSFFVSFTSHANKNGGSITTLKEKFAR
jgi:hypothetical protein